MTTRESIVEGHLVQFCEGLGIKCRKLRLASQAGWPDRTLMYRGRVMFLELKRGGERPTPLQMYTLDQLIKEGFEARWSSDLEQMKLIVLAWRQYVDTQK